MFCAHVRTSSTGTLETSWSIVRRHLGTLIRVPSRTLHLRSTIISRGRGLHEPRVSGGVDGSRCRIGVDRRLWLGSDSGWNVCAP